MAGRGSLRIDTSTTEDGQARVVVTDTGPGIDADHVDRLLEPFFTTKAAHEGSGLGLAISHEIIAEHGGALCVASEPGAGTSFYLEIPLCQERPEP
jgi:signal transduction histidine kinase